MKLSLLCFGLSCWDHVILSSVVSSASVRFISQCFVCVLMDGSWDTGIMFLKHLFSGLSAFHGWSISLKTNCLATFLAPGEGMCIRIQSHVFCSVLLHMHLSMQFYLCFHITSVIIFWAAVWPSDWEFQNNLTWYTFCFIIDFVLK